MSWQMTRGAPRRSEPALLLELLGYAAKGAKWDRVPATVARRFEDPGNHQIQWVIDAGLGPLLCHAIRHNITHLPAAWRDVLRSADLTAQVRHGNLIDTTNEIIDACHDVGAWVTLLKGISISEQHYPFAHLRPMGDIDILVPECAYDSIESVLLRHGFLRCPGHLSRNTSHHGPPLLHPGRQVWVELHTSLFRKGAALRSGHTFSPSHVTAQLVHSSFYGRPVYRLSDELQLVYIASSWLNDLSRYKIHPSFVTPLLDTIFVLRAAKQTLDWTKLFVWLDNTNAVAALYIMLSYLSRLRLQQVAPEVLCRLARSQDAVGPWELEIIQALLDRYLVEGIPIARGFSSWQAMIVLNTLLEPGSRLRRIFSLPWKVAFPPGIPDRYSIRFQLRRFGRLLRAKC